MEHRGYSLILVRFGRTVESDGDEYLWQIYRPDGKLIGDRWTLNAAIEFVDSLPEDGYPDGFNGPRVDDHS